MKQLHSYTHKLCFELYIYSHSGVVKQQPVPTPVQHSPGPLTGDMYTVPKKFEVKSSKSSHEYDTVPDTFESM